MGRSRGFRIVRGWSLLVFALRASLFAAWSAAIAIATVSAPALADDLRPTSRIVAVTVYPGSALVSREAEVAIPAGPSRVLIEGLPAVLDPALVTASGEGNFVIEGVEVRRVPAAEATAPRVRELMERIEAAQNGIAQIDAEIQALEATSAYLVKMGDVARDGARRDLEQGRLRPEDMMALVASYQMQTRDIGMKLLEARQKKAVDRRALEALQRELREIQAAAGRDRVTAVVLVSAASAARGKIRLRYGVSGATWQPIYDGRGLMDEGAVQLTYSAEVRQATGEEWENVELTLSTAQPALGASIPDLDPWYLRPLPPEPMPGVGVLHRSGAAPAPRTAYSTANVAQAEMEEIAGGAYEEASRAQVMTATVSAGINASFTLPARTTITGDNQPRKVQILSQKFAARFVYRVIPEHGERAYVVAKFANTTDALFLPGSVTAFQGNDYVGMGRVAMVSPGDTFELQLGIDPSVKVERRLIENVTDPQIAGFGPKKSRVTRRYRVLVQNARRIPVTLNLYDRVPVSQNDEIKVERTRPTMEPAETRDDGIQRWEMTIPAGERRTVEFGWKVEFPQGMIIPGL